MCQKGILLVVTPATLPAEILEMFRAMVNARASDIHLQAGAPPTIRVDGDLQPFSDRPLTPRDVEAIAMALLTPEQRSEVDYHHEMDFAYTMPGFARFRCNLMRQRGSLGLVMRVIAEAIPSFDALGLPRTVLEHLCAQERGLVLVTGPTGSGKSTTLATMLDHINQNSARNIITIEDPIEFLHRHKRGLVVQREVGMDTASFASGLKYALRQDPDVILIGEMRDVETVEAALMAAQTGHLVFSTLHTLDAIRSINRIVDFFAKHEHQQVRLLLSESLLGIFSQRLVRRSGNAGRTVAMEVLISTPYIRELLKDEQKIPEIRQAITLDNPLGMQSFDQHLVRLFTEGSIDLEAAISAATSPHEFKLLLTKVTGKTY